MHIRKTTLQNVFGGIAYDMHILVHYTSQKAILSLMSFFQKWPEMRKLYHISIFYIYSVICNGMKNFRVFI